MWEHRARAGWTPYQNGPQLDCWHNAPSGAPVPVQPIANMAQLSLSGNATQGGSDTAVMYVGNTAYSTPPNPDSVLNLAQGWREVEFNIFGDACSSQAVFQGTPKIVVRESVTYGSPKAPTCQATGFTGETNNLSFGPAAPVPSGTSPAILFTESSAGGVMAACAAATSVGDTHLATFDGLLYDFQASGDFVLVHANPDFVVQTRQVSGAPSWPNASTNTAVATQMGKTRVAICLRPTRLMIDGTPTDLGDGKSLSLPSGVAVSRNGNVYLIVRRSGDTVRATLNNNGQNSWIDVSVGMGYSHQAKVRGLLGNANGNHRRRYCDTPGSSADAAGFIRRSLSPLRQ
jgi:von Willebrand factor type D domain